MTPKLHARTPPLRIPCCRQHRPTHGQNAAGGPRTRGRAAEWVVDDTGPPPAHVAELAMVATKVQPPRAASHVGVHEAGAQHPAAIRVELEHVPAGQGSWETRERRGRRIHGVNR